ncbi:MAG: class I adenylate-forming enzyme family protein [Candidatus Shapirobacteria bacterium]
MHNFDSLITVCDFLENSARNFSDKTGLIFEDKEFNYREIKKQSDLIRDFLIKKTNKGDVVAIFLPNIPEIIFSYFGTLSSGCTVLLVPTNISDKNLIFQIKKIKPRFIISQNKYNGKFKRVGISAENIIDIDYISNEKSVCIEKRIVNPEDPSTIMFTSGTTGEPKGVKLKHQNVVSATKNIIHFLNWNSEDLDVNILPLCHSFGLGNIHCAFAVGATTILFRDAINLKKIIRVIVEKKVTTFASVPAILRLIVDNYMSEFKECGRFLRFVQTNTSFLEEELIKKIINVLPNTDLYYYYGLTEASRSTFIALNKNLGKIKSVGRPLDGVDLKIIDTKGNTLGPMNIGRICIKGNHVIEEYWDNKEASLEIKNGWLCTGDAGFLDKDGFLYFFGRNDDIINVSGEKVMPEEIEEIARNFPGVKEAVAVGVADNILGERVKLFVVPSNDVFNKNLLLEKIKKNLENYKIPKEISIIDKVFYTDNGKIQRNKVRDYYAK